MGRAIWRNAHSISKLVSFARAAETAFRLRHLPLAIEGRAVSCLKDVGFPWNERATADALNIASKPTVLKWHNHGKLRYSRGCPYSLTCNMQLASTEVL